MNKYERCIQSVKRKQDSWCTDHKFKRGVNPRTGKKCVNPWAICTTSVGRPTRKVYTGPRGGKYVIVKGVKKYI